MTNKELLAQVAKEQRELARLEGQRLRKGTPEWDPYYLELEYGEDAMKYVTSRPFNQLDNWYHSGKQINFQSTDITGLVHLWFESGLWGKPAQPTKQAITPRPEEWGTFS